MAVVAPSVSKVYSMMVLSEVTPNLKPAFRLETGIASNARGRELYGPQRVSMLACACSSTKPEIGSLSVDMRVKNEK